MVTARLAGAKFAAVLELPANASNARDAERALVPVDQPSVVAGRAAYESRRSGKGRVALFAAV